MITTLSSPAVRLNRPSHLLSWGAIFGGCFAALSIHILLTMLGLGLGIRWVNPLGNDNPAGDFTVAAGLVWTISALISMAIGGWVAGRSIDVGDRRSGGLHGFVVWSVATVAVFGFIAGGASMLVSGAAKAVGEGASGAAKIAQSVGLPQQIPVDQIAGNAVNGLVGQVRVSGNELSSASRQTVGLALTRFAADQSPENRSQVVNALTSAGVSPEEANRTVQGWESTLSQTRGQLQNLKSEAGQEARQAADKAAKPLSHGALWTFVGFLLGAIAATLAGRAGAASAQEAPVDEVAGDLSSRPAVPSSTQTGVPRSEDVVR
jgi:hypothetical protein